MRLCDLLAPIAGAFQVVGPNEQHIRGLAYDSRQVKPGSLFVAIKGYHTDGHRYISQAVERGAVAIVVDTRFFPFPPDPKALPTTVSLIGVPNSRAALAPLAAAFSGYPAQQLTVVGITGTKGKTTTTTLVSHLLEQTGHTTGMITGVDLKVGPRQWENTLSQSTPEALEIQTMLRDMADSGCNYAILEASSHGLAANWNRLGNCAFAVAVCTNVTHEHLDYHGTLEQYRRDKARLFALLGEPAGPGCSPPARSPVAIVNADDPHHQLFLDAAPVRAERLRYALDAPADIRGTVLHHSPKATRLYIQTPWGDASTLLPLPGRFNASNALAALSVALCQGMSLEQAATALEQAPAVRGRMQQIDEGQPFGVVVDYAHNPDSFEQVMGMFRPLVGGRMIAVFGSAGERDQAKRWQQGAIAARFCNLLILTDEDPRGEDRQAILSDIARGAEQEGKQAGSGYLLIPDRAAAIRTAINEARSGDLVLLLGKGHERSIRYAERSNPWDEAAEARAALREQGYGVVDLV